MYTVKIFDKEIQVRDHYCQLNNLPLQKIKEPYINIYVSMTNFCNANCMFCCNEDNRHTNIKFDIHKFKNIIQELNQTIKINKCSFTGGEPTIQFKLLADSINFVKQVDSSIFTVVNTNGTRLKMLTEILPFIDSVALSRHHYNDEMNKKIFNNDFVPTTKDIAEFPDKNKLHLSCNLIKEYIGSANEVVKYLEWVSTTGCSDIGFVSLMPANEYCKANFVDFKDLHFEEINNVFITKNWNYNKLCRCRNYNYIAQNSEIIDIYARYYVASEYSGNALVFDGQNLRLGFNGEIII